MFGLINRDTLPNSTADEFEHFTSSLKALWLVEHNEDGTHIVRQDVETVPIGGIIMWTAAAVPNSNWELCRGQALSRVTDKALFDIIGTTYGIGDGSTTFNIPDLQQRFPLGKASAGTGATLAATGGTIDHTHSLASLTITGSTGSTSPGTDSQGSHSHGGVTGSEASHTHDLSVLQNGVTATSTAGGVPVDNNLTGSTVSVSVAGHAHFSVNPASGTHTSDAGTSHNHTISSDGSHAHTVNSHLHSAGTLAVSGTEGIANPPYLVLNYIILAR